MLSRDSTDLVTNTAKSIPTKASGHHSQDKTIVHNGSIIYYDIPDM